MKIWLALLICVLSLSALAQPVTPDPNGNCFHALPDGRDGRQPGSLTEQQIRDGHYVVRSRAVRMCNDKAPSP